MSRFYADIQGNQARHRAEEARQAASVDIFADGAVVSEARAEETEDDA